MDIHVDEKLVGANNDFHQLTPYCSLISLGSTTQTYYRISFDGKNTRPGRHGTRVSLAAHIPSCTKMNILYEKLLRLVIIVHWAEQFYRSSTSCVMDKVISPPTESEDFLGCWLLFKQTLIWGSAIESQSNTIMWAHKLCLLVVLIHIVGSLLIINMKLGHYVSWPLHISHMRLCFTLQDIAVCLGSSQEILIKITLECEKDIRGGLCFTSSWKRHQKTAWLFIVTDRIRMRLDWQTVLPSLFQRLSCTK